MSSDRPTRPRPTLREEQRLFTRQRILASAVKVFEERGYTAATVDDIAEEARASRATFYAHFKGKPDIAAALWSELSPSAEESFARLDAILVDGTYADLRGWVQDSLRWYETNRAALLALEGVVAAGDFREAGLDSVPVDAMPHYLKRAGARQRTEARYRVWLLVAQLSRTFFVREAGGLSELNEKTVVDVLTDMSACALRFEPPDGPDRPVRKR